MIGPDNRLAIFVSNMDGGGAQLSMLRLARGISERGYGVDLILARAEGQFLPEVSKSVRVVDLNARRVSTSLPALVRYLRRQQPVAMLSALDYVNIIALWARRLAGKPVRVVVSERSTLSHSAADSSSQRGQLIPPLARIFYPWADGIVAVSNGVADDLAQITGIPRERVRVIHNPVVTSELMDKAKAPLNHPWFEPGQPPVVLAVGRLAAEKDFPTLIRALALVRKDGPVRLLILGEGEDRKPLEVLVEQLGLQADVSLPGFMTNPFAFMAKASLFVLSSKWEGLPSALIEALYCGTPLISTDCPSGPREILAGGEYGRLVPVGDVTQLANAIKSTLADGRPIQPHESWQPYELENVVDQYVSILLDT